MGHGGTVGAAPTRLHADDLGATAEVNATVARLLRAGRLVGVSVLANGEATDEALTLVARHPEVAVHVHVNLTEGRPLTPPPALRPLTGPDGAFVGIRGAALALVRGRCDERAIADEVAAQVDRVVAAGVTVAALDTHHHLHALAPVGAVVARVAGERRLAVARAYSQARTHTIRGAGRKAGLSLLARTTHWTTSRRVSLPAGWRSLDGAASPPFAVASWEHLRSGRPAGATIVVCHPGGACDRNARHLDEVEDRAR